ncbi:MAG: SpoIVB peptidase, partial [Oscillospiraceae bacterium]
SYNIKTEISQDEGNDLQSDKYEVKLKLPHGPVIKTANVNVVKRNKVVPSGAPFGIKMFTKGVMVVGLTDVDVNGHQENPAKDAGIRSGDIVLKIGSADIKLNENLSEEINKTHGKPVNITIMRDDILRDTVLTPIKSSEGDYKAGMWVRDSSAGIGTLTYYNPSTKVFGGLGHAVCDIDTGAILPIDHGEAVGVVITGVTKGMGGAPGELRGTFSNNSNIGSLNVNNETGIFGFYDNCCEISKPVEVAISSEVKEGPAYILTTIDGNYPKPYAINIEHVAFNNKSSTKNMVIRITDKNLLEKTGGIVQGMSGSPIMQNNRLVGAVTHVFVNDPTRGYGIFAENMEKSLTSMI